MPTTTINSTMAVSTSVMHTCTGTLTTTTVVIASSTYITEEDWSDRKRKIISEGSDNNLLKQRNIDASNQTDGETTLIPVAAENLSSDELLKQMFTRVVDMSTKIDGVDQKVEQIRL